MSASCVAPAVETTSPLIALEAVDISFDTRPVLRGLTVEVPARAVCALLGINGAGKTTLLRVLVGALGPTQGRVLWKTTGRRRAAMVAQRVALYQLLTPWENCLAAGRMAGLRGAALLSAAEAAVAQALCDEVKDQIVSRLSGGYQRRAAIAAALMGDAPLVVLDEPTAGLDAESVNALITIVRGLRANGKSVVCATHDFDFADAVADHLWLLRDGRILAADAPSRLRARHFGDKRRVEATFAQEPGPALSDVLSTLEARKLSCDRWSCLCDVDENDLPLALHELRKAGARLREVRISEPGAAALFEMICRGQGSP